MKKPVILLVEDNAVDAAYITKTLSEYGYELAGVGKDVRSAYELFLEKRPQLCVVDIYLNGVPDGVTFVQKIAGEDDTVPVIFLTGSQDRLTFHSAKTTNPSSYLLKPYNPLELQYAIDLALEKVKKVRVRESDALFVKRGNYLTKLDVHEILYIEVDGKYSKIISATEKFLVQQPLKELHLQLPHALFFRVHRNYLVNIHEIARIDTIANEVLFKNKTSLPISRRYLDHLMERFRVLK